MKKTIKKDSSTQSFKASTSQKDVIILQQGATKPMQTYASAKFIGGAF